MGDNYDKVLEHINTNILDKLFNRTAPAPPPPPSHEAEVIEPSVEEDTSTELLQFEKHLTALYNIINPGTSDCLMTSLRYNLKKDATFTFQQFLEPIYNLTVLKYKTKNTHIQGLINNLFFSAYADLSTTISTHGAFLKNTNLLMKYTIIYIWLQGEFSITSKKNTQSSVYGKSYIDKLEFILPRSTPFDQFISHQLSADCTRYAVTPYTKITQFLQNVVNNSSRDGIKKYNFSSFVNKTNEKSNKVIIEHNVLEEFKKNLVNEYLKTLLFNEFKNKELHKVCNFYAKISVTHANK